MGLGGFEIVRVRVASKEEISISSDGKAAFDDWA
jgi:hypothetical protein